jgi:hypothetical protein
MVSMSLSERFHDMMGGSKAGRPWESRGRRGSCPAWLLALWVLLSLSLWVLWPSWSGRAWVDAAVCRPRYDASGSRVGEDSTRPGAAVKNAE